jgi:glutamyl-tRNA synthetase
MNDGSLGEGTAVVRVKTSVNLPDPALRDWPALRIQHSLHPMVGNKYKVWPLLDFQSAIEDYLQGVTHIIRGKDLMDSTRKQTLLYEHFDWEYPETLYWGRVKIHEFGSFSTSGMRKDIEKGFFNGWDDPRLPTLRALQRRGFDADAMKDFWIDLGLTQKDISVSLQTIEAFNSSVIDDRCERRAFVRDPELLDIEFIDGNYLSTLSIKRHPMSHIKGDRIWDLSDRKIYVEKKDLLKKEIRLKDFADVEIKKPKVSVQSYERLDKRAIVHWLPISMAKKAILTIPEGDKIVIQEGMMEDFELVKGSIVQLERVGYAIIESENNSDIIQLLWLHG